MKLETLSNTYLYYRFLPNLGKRIMKVKISKIRGINRSDVDSDSQVVREIVHKLKEKRRIYFDTKEINLIKVKNDFFVYEGGNHRITAIKLCQNDIINKYLLAEVWELSSKRKDLDFAKEKLIHLLYERAKVGLYYCKNCNSNFDSKVVKYLPLKSNGIELGYSPICPLCGNQLR